MADLPEDRQGHEQPQQRRHDALPDSRFGTPAARTSSIGCGALHTEHAPGRGGYNGYVMHHCVRRMPKKRLRPTFTTAGMRMHCRRIVQAEVWQRLLLDTSDLPNESRLEATAVIWPLQTFRTVWRMSTAQPMRGSVPQRDGKPQRTAHAPKSVPNSTRSGCKVMGRRGRRGSLCSALVTGRAHKLREAAACGCWHAGLGVYPSILARGGAPLR